MLYLCKSPHHEPTALVQQRYRRKNGVSLGPACCHLPAVGPAATLVHECLSREALSNGLHVGLGSCMQGVRRWESQLGSLPLPARVRVGAKGQLGRILAKVRGTCGAGQGLGRVGSQASLERSA